MAVETTVLFILSRGVDSVTTVFMARDLLQSEELTAPLLTKSCRNNQSSLLATND